MAFQPLSQKVLLKVCLWKKQNHSFNKNSVEEKD